ncbi:Uncharacterized conserved protein [Prochlorococcus marinus str. MIT 9515]|uniref:Uncharacterized conserved protein n=1 Tax=Prochlorococcus marinus (strain MIT 9515) TaxID=167542 RepID=A2BX51_PROM5|nr:1,4-alpha-glucan branching protein domain-containing protein [Prochlorococcus marinus]ABM72362.1 Uncharacterized conserved protein [Prochlorococcus marinus str. MIT 9515]
MNGPSPNKNYLGRLAIVLHAHLPYVRKNEKNSLEEDWLFQAILECYIPLLKVMESSKKQDACNTKLTLSLSPTLLSLLKNKQIQKKFSSWIKTRIEFLSDLPHEEQAASEFLMRNIKNNYLYWEECNGDLVERFKNLFITGNLDILTCAATHGYLPILRENPETVLGQIKTAIRNHELIFGARPLGIWLPECAYYENLDEILCNCGIRYAVLDGHGILNGSPRPRYGVYAPICSKKGVAFFGRDSESTLPVWSSREGFPGDPVYREYHKDLGWELSSTELQKKGITTSRPLGLKFYRITNNEASLGKKEFYKEDEAIKKIEEHSDQYLLSRSKQLKNLSLSSSFDPLLIAPFDAELFGHWWYEGPRFIENILRKSIKYSIKLTNLKEILLNKPNIQICDPSPSSWGQGGYHNYWLNDKNAWIVPKITKAGSVFVELSSRNFNDAFSIRLLKQAARELLLSESSDWSFILRAGTTTELAKERIDRHLFRFWKLIDMLEKRSIVDFKFIEDIEEEDNIFPEIRIEDWQL